MTSLAASLPLLFLLAAPAAPMMSATGAFKATLLDFSAAVAKSDSGAADALDQKLATDYERLSRAEQRQVVKPFAEARFGRLEPRFKTFQEISFRNAETLATVLKTKIEQLTQLTDGYSHVEELDALEYSAAAACRIGQAYADVTDRLLDAPAPRDLSPEQVQVFRSALVSQISPMGDKAVEAFERCQAKARNGKAPAWSKIARDELKRRAAK